jgi:heme A synthase
MKIVFRTVAFHIICILVFSLIYSTFSNGFKSVDYENEEMNFLDFLLLSTTIQAGVGISEYFPSNPFTKITMILQQLIMISTHVFTLYILTI